MNLESLSRGIDPAPPIGTPEARRPELVSFLFFVGLIATTFLV